MKFACISDIHGNALALDAVLADINKKHADKIYVIGDLYYRGGMSTTQFVTNARIRKTIELFMQSGLSVGEIAYQVGYNDFSCFW